MSDGSAYRSIDAEVLAAWDATMAKYNAYRQRTGAFQDEHPGFVALQRSGFGNSRWICGLRNEDPKCDESPGPGWRWQVSLPGWVPDKRVKAGKAMAKRFSDEFKIGGLAVLPGMPNEVMIPGHCYGHAAFEYERVIYVHWAEEPSEHVEKQKAFVSDKWERIPLSVYYRAQETRDAAKATA